MKLALRYKRQITSVVYQPIGFSGIFYCILKTNGIFFDIHSPMKITCDLNSLIIFDIRTEFPNLTKILHY